MDTSDAKAQTEGRRVLSRKEQIVGATIFLAVSIFFIVLFFAWADSKYRWVLLALGVVALIRGGRHVLAARRLA